MTGDIPTSRRTWLRGRRWEDEIELDQTITQKETPKEARRRRENELLDRALESARNEERNSDTDFKGI